MTKIYLYKIKRPSHTRVQDGGPTIINPPEAQHFWTLLNYYLNYA